MLAPIAGALAPFSLASFNYWPLAILSLALLLWVFEGNTTKQTIWRSWLYGLGFYGVGASWVYFSIHEYGYAPAPLALLLTALFVAGLSLLFNATFGYCYIKLTSNRRFGALLGFPALWVIFEWLRSWVLTGFPWLYLGYGHLDTWLAGWAPIAGVYSISLIIALSASLLFHLFSSRTSKRPATTIFITIITLSLWLIANPLKQVEWTQETGASLKVALIQPNISQHVKWQLEQRPKTLGLLRKMSEQNLAADLVIWPENALPLFVHQADFYIEDLSRLGDQSQTTFITGIPHWQPKSGVSPKQLHNSILAFGNNADGLYHKQKLVPFGEYVPLQEYLRGLIQFFDLPMSDFGTGSSEQLPLTINKGGENYNVAPYICYEIAYPDFARELAGQSNLLLTISDDSWFGASIGPHQHFEVARMRALENGRQLLRGTNNGITAFVDHTGKVIDQAPQFQQSSLTGKVELMKGLTPFTRWGSAPVLLFCLALILLSTRLGKKKTSKSKTS